MTDYGLTHRHKLLQHNGDTVIIKSGDKDEIVNEKFFQKVLKDHHLPSLTIYESDDLSDEEIMMEYVPDNEDGDAKVTKNFMYKWGQLVKQLHAISYDHVFLINGESKQQETSWKDYLQSRINATIKKNALKSNLMKRVLHSVQPLLDVELKNPSLLHGDLHSNNILIRGDEYVLFDQGCRIRTGDPLYDLAIVFIGFPNGRYVQTNQPEYKNDSEFLQSFCAGYGSDFIEENIDRLNLYVLLRSFERHPNLYEPFLEDIIQFLLRGK